MFLLSKVKSQTNSLLLLLPPTTLYFSLSVNSSPGCSNGGPEVGKSPKAKETHWLVTTQGVDKSAYDLHKNEKVSCSAFQGKTTWAMISVWWSGDSRSNTRQCIITHNALRLPPSPANNFWLLYGLIVSHAGVFRGAHISSLPTTRDEIRLTTAING